MSVAQTSILAYLKDVKPQLNKRQQSVLEAIEDISPADNKMIAKHLGWEINSVTPRVLELRKKGKVVTAFIQRDYTGRKVTFWKTKGMVEATNDGY